jgi:hypothetical protein
MEEKPAETSAALKDFFGNWAESVDLLCDLIRSGPIG